MNGLLKTINKKKKKRVNKQKHKVVYLNFCVIFMVFSRGKFLNPPQNSSKLNEIRLDLPN